MGLAPDDTQTRLDAEGRRSPRILRRVRLHIRPDNGVNCDATTAVINREGALILSPRPLPYESRVKITNLERGVSHPFRVVWCGEPVRSLHKLGVELLDTKVDFWGPALRQEPED